MATIRRRKWKGGASYQVQVRLAGCAPVSRSFPTREEAIAWARAQEGSLQDARARAESGEHLLGEAIKRYLATVVPRKTKSTQRVERDRLRWWYDNHATVPLSEVSAPMIAAARDALSKDRQPATVNRYLAVLSQVMTHAEREWEWAQENPVRRVKKLREPAGRVRFLSPEELKALLSVLEARPMLAAVVELALGTGLRRGELIRLRWSDVDLARRLVVVMGKNHERRGIPLSARVVEALRKLPRRVDTPLLFPGPRHRDKPWEFEKTWKAAVFAAGLEDFHFHDLRHTTASYLAMNGATEREIAEVLGHKTLQMVKRYTHLSREHLAGLMEDLSHAMHDQPRRASRSKAAEREPEK